MTHLSFYQKITFAGLALFIFAAFFSIGYHHPDEHFQIIEFANYKMGNIPASDLSWEFEKQIRPGLPVLVCYSIFSVFNSIGIDHPFILAFFLRLITALMAWLVLKRIAFQLLPDFKTETGKKIFFLLIFLLWFMPYIHVRFSSENLAAVTFLLAVSFILNKSAEESSKKFLLYFSAGLLLCFSFYFRFQMGFAILGLGLWLFFIQRLNWKGWLLLCLGGFIALALCIVSDYWLYGEWVLTPENYFNANIVENIASAWGVSPWWYYAYMFFLQVIPPISIVLLLFFGWGFSKKITHIFTWILIPFLLIHFWIGHKEMRFLFPMIIPVLYLAAIGIDQFIETKKWQRATRLVFICLVVCNMPFLLFRTFAPARELLYYHWYLYELAGDKKIELMCIGEDVYRPSQLPIHFYTSPNVSTLAFENHEVLQKHLSDQKPETVYVLDQDLNQKNQYPGYSQKTCFSILPEWVTKININDWTNHAKIWEVKELRRINTDP